MSWVAVAIGGSAVVGALGSISASKDASQARDAATAASERSNAISQQLANISQEQWDTYKNEGLPMIRELAGMRTTTDRTDEEMALAAGDVKSQFAGARSNLTQALERSRNPADPGYAAALAPSYMDEAAGVSTAVTEARRAERQRVQDFGWNRTLQAIQAYQGLPNQAIAAGTAAGTQTSRNQTALTNMAGLDDARAAQAAYGGIAVAGAARRWLPGNTATAPAPGQPGSFESMNQGFGTEFDPASAAYGGAYAGGGRVRALGRVRGPGTGTSDSINANLSKGEYVIPADVVKIKGQEFFDKILQKYHRPVAGPNDGMANGGPVLRGRGLPKAVDDAIFHSIPNRAVSRARRY